jgi:hypothetical protein
LKSTEHEATDGVTPNTIITVKLCNGKRFFNAPPFPSINRIVRAGANAFNKWGKCMLTQMYLKAPVKELMSQLEYYLPIATASALMKEEKISDQLYNEFFKINNLDPQSFCYQYHKKIKFSGQGVVANPPAGLEFFRVTVNLDPVQIFPYIKEPAFIVTYDLALKETPNTTTAPESILRNSTTVTTATTPTASRILFNDEGTPTAAPLVVLNLHPLPSPVWFYTTMDQMTPLLLSPSTTLGISWTHRKYLTSCSRRIRSHMSPFGLRSLL